MLCRSTSTFSHQHYYRIIANTTYRYEIGSGATDWQDAERTISKAAKDGKVKDITIAVKTGEKKRKVGEAVEEAFKEAEKFKEGAGKKKKQKSRK
jgi:N-acetyltransferase 10